MRALTFPLYRTLLIGFAGLAMLSPVQAQSAAGSAGTPADVGAPASGRQNQKIEHIRIEDRGAVVDETRYGGQTQSIKVQPKANVPSYEVRPNDGRRGASQDRGESGGNGNGPRVWNVLKF